MSVDRDEHGEIVYTYTPMSDSSPKVKGGSQIKLRRQDVLHIPGLGFDGLVGYSPIAMARNAVGMTLACEEYGASFFANGARPGEVLKHPRVLKDPSKLRESWQAVYGGTANTGKVVVLEEGVDYQQISIPPEEAQFLETRKFQIDEIARLYRVPPHAATINGVLANEKYTGCARIQKTFTPDFLTKKVVKNTGQVPSYFVEQSHPAIISPETFEMVQAEVARRKQEGGRYSGVSIFLRKMPVLVEMT